MEVPTCFLRSLGTHVRCRLASRGTDFEPPKSPAFVFGCLKGGLSSTLACLANPGVGTLVLAIPGQPRTNPPSLPMDDDCVCVSVDDDSVWLLHVPSRGCGRAGGRRSRPIPWLAAWLGAPSASPAWSARSRRPSPVLVYLEVPSRAFSCTRRGREGDRQGRAAAEARQVRYGAHHPGLALLCYRHEPLGLLATIAVRSGAPRIFLHSITTGVTVAASSFLLAITAIRTAK